MIMIDNIAFDYGWNLKAIFSLSLIQTLELSKAAEYRRKRDNRLRVNEMRLAFHGKKEDIIDFFQDEREGTTEDLTGLGFENKEAKK